MTKKPTVSVGIPAYNEEANITHLLNSLLRQQEDNFLLKEIIVVSDGSTDGTVTEATRVNNAKVHIIRHNKRKGKTIRQNEFIQTFIGDILVILDADTIPESKYFIARIVKPFLNDEEIGIVSGQGVPLKAQGYFEKVLNISVKMKQEIFEEFSKGDNLYLCRGEGRGFSRKFLEKFRWPPIIGEDAFSYFQCKEFGFKFHYKASAKLLYRLPNNLEDHLKRGTRFLASKRKLEMHLGKDRVNQGYKIPISLKIRKTMKYLSKNPLLLSSYLIILILTRIKFIFIEDHGALWSPAASTKQLVNTIKEESSESLGK